MTSDEASRIVADLQEAPPPSCPVADRIYRDGIARIEAWQPADYQPEPEPK